MKLILLSYAGILGLMSLSQANAQSCASPTTIASSTTVSGNSCVAPTGTGDSSVGTLCNGLNNTGPVFVYTWTHGTGTVSGNIVVTPTTAWDPAIVVANGATCSAALGGFCNDQQDSNGAVAGAGGAETTSLSNEATNSTTFYLVISSFAASPAQACGPFTVQAGQLPVKLQKFSVN